MNLQERVKILSGLENQEIYKWYQTCSVFVNLSSLEAFGITVLEAIAAGKPVVVSAIPAFRELAYKLNGIQVVEIPGTNPRELANLITQSIKSTPPPNEIGEFSWDSITESVLQVYRCVLEREVRA